MEKIIIKTESSDMTAKIFGSYDVNARMIEKTWGVNITASGDDGGGIAVSGADAESVAEAARTLKTLVELAGYSENLTEQTVRYVIDMVCDGRARSADRLLQILHNPEGLR